MKVSSMKKQAPPQQQSQRREEAEEQGSPAAAEAMDVAAAAAQEEEEAAGCSGKAPEAEAEGRTVVVGVREPADAESRALLTWVLVNVAAPLDHVVAVHVVLASAAEAAAAVDFEAMLGVYEGFCNLKQVAALCSAFSLRLGSLPLLIPLLPLRECLAHMPSLPPLSFRFLASLDFLYTYPPLFVC